jgi:hypothetical protein
LEQGSGADRQLLAPGHLRQREVSVGRHAAPAAAAVPACQPIPVAAPRCLRPLIPGAALPPQQTRDDMEGLEDDIELLGDATGATRGCNRSHRGLMGGCKGGGYGIAC